MAPELKDELLAWVADPDNTPFPDAAVASAVAAHFAQWETILNRLAAGFDGWWEIHGPQLEALAEQLETAATQTIGATPIEMKNPHTELTEAAQALKDAQTDDGARVALDRIDPDISFADALELAHQVKP